MAVLFAALDEGKKRAVGSRDDGRNAEGVIALGSGSEYIGLLEKRSRREVCDHDEREGKKAGCVGGHDFSPHLLSDIGEVFGKLDEVGYDEIGLKG